MTGAGGRLAGLLRAAWAAVPPDDAHLLWSGRSEGFDLQWDILHGPAPDWPHGAVVLHLAGIVRGPVETLRQNSAHVGPLLAACRRNRVAGVVLMSSASVYTPSDMASEESAPLAPTSDYGMAKAKAEAEFLAAETLFFKAVLRLGNVVGADALFGPRHDAGPIRLDPIPGSDRGPVRSWIGPVTLSRVLIHLCRAAAASAVPPVLNVAAEPPLPMADLLDASGLPWAFGAPNPAVLPRAVLSTQRLAALYPVPPATPHGLMGELAAVRGHGA